MYFIIDLFLLKYIFFINNKIINVEMNRIIFDNFSVSRISLENNC